MTPENELLRLYAEKHDEAAFTEFVRQHLSLVYAAALRLTQGNASLAEEVAQGVFTDVARKARGLSRHPALKGWLHTSVRFAAANAIRAEHTRRVYEEEASVMHDAIPDAREVCWAQLRPLLDEALGRLREQDRDAVLRRYFAEQSHREVGAALGLSENAAQMRVDRALEKLRGYFARRGVTTSAALLASTLAARASVVSVPPAFATSVAGKSLAGAAGAGIAGGKLGGAWSSFVTSKTKVAAGLAAVVAMAAATVWHYSPPEKASSPTRQAVAASPMQPLAPASVAVAGPAVPDGTGAAILGAGSATATAVGIDTATATSVANTVQNASLLANSSANTNPPPVARSTLSVSMDMAPDGTTLTAAEKPWPVSEPVMHAFTDLQGRQMQAEITSVAGPLVSIKRDDGTAFTVQKNIFQPADQDYIQRWADNAAAKEAATHVAEARAAAAETAAVKAAVAKAQAAHALPPDVHTSLVTFGVAKNGELGTGALGVSDIRHGPGFVDTSGVLKGKTIVAIASGWSHRLALCSDGTLAAWGDNSSGQLGNGKSGGGLISTAPILVDTSAMAGKKIVAIGARADSSTALCEDGTVYQWGGNGIIFDWGGARYSMGKSTPQWVNVGALKDKKVVAITGGLALCTDGSIVTWLEGAGNPEVIDATGVLKDKTVVQIADPEMALCADGTAVTWKLHARTGLGVGDKPDVPTSIDRDDLSHLLRGKTITRLAENVVFCSDGSVFLWGKVNNSVGGMHRVVPLNVYASSHTNILRNQPDPATTGNAARSGNQTQTAVPLLQAITPVAVADADASRPSVTEGTTNHLWILGEDGMLGEVGTGYRSGPDKNLTLNVIANQGGVLRGKKIIALANGMALYELRGQ